MESSPKAGNAITKKRAGRPLRRLVKTKAFSLESKELRKTIAHRFWIQVRPTEGDSGPVISAIFIALDGTHFLSWVKLPTEMKSRMQIPLHIKPSTPKILSR